jgi:acylphosphatase
MTTADPAGVGFVAVVHGSVQGVGFRYYTRSVAHRFGVYGYVMNQPDGTVKVVCEGPSAATRKMLEWLDHGPPSARVTTVDTEWYWSRRGYSSFTVEF